MCIWECFSNSCFFSGTVFFFHVFVVASSPGGDWTPFRTGVGKDGWPTSSLQQEQKTRTGEGYGTCWVSNKRKKIQNLSQQQSTFFSKGCSIVLPKLNLTLGSFHISPLIPVLLLLTGNVQTQAPGPVASTTATSHGRGHLLTTPPA